MVSLRRGAQDDWSGGENSRTRLEVGAVVVFVASAIVARFMPAERDS